ncbi:ABC transporter ATP-binding protein [Dietzia kunjamensis]
MTMTQTRTPVLKATGLHAGYGQIKVLHGIDVEVHPGEVVAVLGANGAGKTTLLRAMSGMIRYKGRLDLHGRDVSGKPAETLVKRGVAHVPQGRGTFPDLTVDENLEIGAFVRRDKAAKKRNLEMIREYFPILAERRSDRAGGLSGGEQQMLALGRALMSSPEVLLLDEPSLGLAPLIVRKVFDIIRDINAATGLTVLLVEQNADIALQIADRAYLIEAGEIAMSMSADELVGNEQIRKAYLGY